MMKTGIVILNYNDYKTTKEMLNQIKDYKTINNIIVVDNNSTDDSYNILKEYENKKIKIIKTDMNKGYAYGNNYGIKYLIKNYTVDNIIISNPDIIVEEKTLKVLIDDLNDKNVDFIAPVIKEREYEKKGWKLPTYLDDLLSNINYFHKYADKRLNYDDSYYNENLTKVDVISGCFFIAKASSFKKINYFDENTFLYYEENIIGKKLKEANLNTYVDNRVSVIHNLSISVDKSINRIKKYKILKNSQKYYEKVYNRINIFQMLLLRLFYYISLLIAYMVYLVQK